MTTRNRDRATTADEWPPTETPESRMTGEGGPPPDEREKTAADDPAFAVTDAPEDSENASGHGRRSDGS
ncbi:hypothetical protein [Kitasatospora camelliae]|uniref:Uncharacterized protein n=1 Tax=Kitasatospora camelliae TaxID=3156397 RepID=A0AAU8JSU1_9ACTN